MKRAGSEMKMKKKKQQQDKQQTTMNIMEAINDVCRWLLRLGTVFTLAYAQELTPTHYRIAIHQHAPTVQHRLFEVVPTDITSCWNVVELSEGGDAPTGEPK
jgi:hypothetical protein